MIRTNLMAALVLVVPAMGLSPLERQIHAERNRLRYGTVKVAMGVRDRVSQNTAIALLAGFRSIVADFLWIHGHGYFEKREWLRQYRDMETSVLLEPQSALFWDVGAWHMAWNIGYAVSVDPSNRTFAVGIKRQREWWDKARDFLRRGQENIPNRPDLYFSTGWLYAEKYKEPCKAQEYYHKALTAPEPPACMGIRLEGVERLEARAKEDCGDSKGAYQCWMRIWFEDHNRSYHPWSVVEREIKRLENVLNISDQQRVFPVGKSKPTTLP